MSIVASLDVMLKGNTADLDGKLANSEKNVKHFNDLTNNLDSKQKPFANPQFDSKNQKPLFANLQFKPQGVEAARQSIANSFSSGLGLDKLAAVGQSVGNIFEGLGMSVGTMSAGATVAIGGVVIALAAVAAAAVAGTAAIVAMASSGISSLQGLGKSAQSFNISTQAMAGLELAAAKAGVGTEELNHSLMHLQKTISEAEHGGAEAIVTLNRLGLTGQDLAGIPLDQAFAKVEDAIHKTGTAADKTALQLKTMGKSSFDILRIGQGDTSVSASLAKTKQEAIDMGLAVGQAQTDAARRVGASWKMVSAAFTGISRTLGVMLAPAFEMVGNAAQAVATWLAKAVVSAMPYWTAFADAVKEVWNTLAEAGSTVLSSIGEMLTAVGLKVDGWGTTWQNFRDMFLTAMFATQFAAKNWQVLLTLAVDQIELRVVEFANTVVAAFTKTIPEAFRATWELLKDMTNGDFSGAFDKFGDKLGEAFKRPVTALEGQLKAEIQQLGNQVGEDFDRFMAKKFNDFKAKKQALEITPDQGKGEDNVAKRPQIAEAGSKEAFSIIQNTLGKKDGDKMFAVANKQLEENQKMAKLLAEVAKQLAGKVVVAKAGL